jgi:MFS family permease
VLKAEDKEMSQKQSNRFAIVTAWCVCILASIFYCYEFFLRVAPSVMVPNLMSAYGVTAGGLAIMSASYYYIYTPMQLPVGILMDRYGPRRLLTLAVFLCALGSLLIAGVLNLYVGAFARLLMGFGSAFAFVGVLKLAAHWLPPSRLAFVSGMSTALGMLGAVAGDTALTSMVDALGWRSSWVIAGIAGLVLTVLIWLVIHDNPVHKRHMKRETRSWGQAWKYFLSILKNTQFWINGLIGGVMFLPVSVFGALWGISFLEQAYGFSSHEAGLSVSMLFIGVAVSGPIMGWFSSYIKRRRIILMMGSLGAAILFFVLLYVPELSLTTIQVILFFIGACVGCQVVVFAVGCEISSPKAAGTAVAGTNFFSHDWRRCFSTGCWKIIRRVLDPSNQCRRLTCIWLSRFSNSFMRVAYQFVIRIFLIFLFKRNVLQATGCRYSSQAPSTVIKYP